MAVTQILPQIVNLVQQQINSTVKEKYINVDPIPSPVPTQSKLPSDDPKDLRIKISLPPESPNIFYKDKSNLLLSPLEITAGFLFPVQPAISVSHVAEYQSVKPTHSNFPYYYYNNSEIQAINITGEFPVRSVSDAKYVNAGIHFLRSCTRMFNGKDGALAGAPPMVVRLNGLGFSGFDNIPVVITSVLVNYVDSVDYITFKPFGPNGTEKAKLPTTVSIQVNMNPVFSRDFITNQYSTLGYSAAKVRMMGPSLNTTASTSTSTTASGNRAVADSNQQKNVSTSGPKIPGSPAGFGASVTPTI